MLETVLKEQIEKNAGVISYYSFIQTALYAPSFGYYRTLENKRIGYSPNSDFYTAQTLKGSVFEDLLTSAIQNLLKNQALKEYTFIELGAEHEINFRDHPFKNYRACGIEQFSQYDFKGLLEGPCIVFANELLDAQPFYRLIFQAGAWQEIGIYDSNGQLQEIIQPIFSPELLSWIAENPLPTQDISEGYLLDLPLGAKTLFERILQEPWRGLLVFFDYGKRAETLYYDTPGGTARAYYKHEQSNNLLQHPGKQDITCHLNWDFHLEALKEHGFTHLELKRQESFFMKYAFTALELLMQTAPPTQLETKATLLELLSPQHMGAAFQVLVGKRGG